MHARARLPQKRIRTKKPAQMAPETALGQAPAPAKVAKARKPAAAARPIPAAANPVLADLAAHRALRSRDAAHPASAKIRGEIYGLAEWIGPARDSWRRGEIEVHRSACLAMRATRNCDGSVTVTEIPGYGTAAPVAAGTIAALASGALSELVLALPGLRITFTAAELLRALPATPKSAQVLAFPARRSA